MERDRLRIDFCGVECENPFFLSSSVVASNYEMCAKALDAGWGGIVSKTVGVFVANEVSPRFDAIRKESTPFVGFKNLEQISDHTLEENMVWMERLKRDFPQKVLVASIMGRDEGEWTLLAQKMTEVGADILECNFSCPQMTVSSMGSDVGQDPGLVQAYSAAAKRGTHLPVLAKMTPNIGNMEIPAIAAMEGGADGIAAINTIKCITNVDTDKRVPLPSVGGKCAVSGYSGKAVKPVALRFIHDLGMCPELTGIPISGIGGIETWRDALEFFLMGASNIQITTAVMQYGYRIIDDLLAGMMIYMEEKGIRSIDELVGGALENTVSAEHLDRETVVYPVFDQKACIGCGRCYLSCFDGGHQAISWDEQARKPHVDGKKCVGCQLCSRVCPAQAIREGRRVPKRATA